MIIVEGTFRDVRDGRMLGLEEVLGGRGRFEKLRLIVRETAPRGIT